MEHSPTSSVGRATLALVRELTPSKCQAGQPEASVVEPPPFVPPPPCTLSTALPMHRIARLVVAIMAATEQCLYRTNNDDALDEAVLNVDEIEELAGDLRTAIALTEYPVHEEFEYKPNSRTSLGTMLFVIETRLHLFCRFREWEATPLEDHATLASYPSLALHLGPCDTPFLFASLSQLWTLCKNLTDRWNDWNRDDASRVDVAALAAVIHHLFARVTLLTNTPYERDTLDVSEYVQPVEVSDNPRVILNPSFMWDFALVFHSIFQEVLVFQSVMGGADTDPTPTQGALLARYRPHVKAWLHATLAAAQGDDLVSKFEEFYHSVEQAVDVGLPIRVGRLQRLDFDQYKEIEALFSHPDPVIVDSAYKFAIHYVLEQHCNALPWLGYVCHERIRPSTLWTKWTAGFPRILRVPLLNSYAVVVDSEEQTVFEHPLDAWIVWLYAVRDNCQGKIRHPESGLWVSFAKLLRTFEIIVETKAQCVAEASTTESEAGESTGGPGSGGAYV